MEEFTLYFYYIKRESLKQSFLLEYILPSFKLKILNNFTKDNYTNYIWFFRLLKWLFVSLLYTSIYFIFELNESFVYGLSFTILSFLAFFTGLILFSMSYQTIHNIDKDHFFRMLGLKRNEFVKTVLTKRIETAFLDWLIPLTLTPFIYLSVVTDGFLFIEYTLLMAFYYLMLYYLLFLTQKFYYDTTRNHVVIAEISVYFFTLLALSITVFTHFSLLVYASNLSNQLAYVLMFGFIILLLGLFKQKIYHASVNYSLTNTVIMKRPSKASHNRIIKPYRWLKFVIGNDLRMQQLLMKDLITFIRKDKREVFALVTVNLMVLFYTFLVVSSIAQNETLVSLFSADNIMLSILMIFILVTLYRYKDFTWVRTEKHAFQFFKAFKINRFDLYKVKLRLNQLLFLPAFIMYSVIPLVGFIYFQTDLLYGFLRVIVIMLYALCMTKYPILLDALTVTKEKDDKLGFLSHIDLGFLIIVFQWFFITFVLFGINQTTHAPALMLGFMGLLALVLLGIFYRLYRMEKRLEKRGYND